jgi:hypothetical protein
MNFRIATYTNLYNCMKYYRITHFWTQTLALIPTWIAKASTVIRLQTEKYPNSFVVKGRSLQNGIKAKKRNKIDKQIQQHYSDQLLSLALLLVLLHQTTTPGLGLLLFWFRDVWYFTERGCQPLPSTQHGGPALRIQGQEARWHNYIPRHWVARDPGSATSRTHSNCEPLRAVCSTVGGK